MSRALAVTDSTFAKEVLESDLPVLVDVWATWCPPCRMLSPVVDQVAAESAGRLKVVKVDADQNPAVVERLRIHSLPTLTLLSGGREVGRQVGFVSKAELHRFVAAHLAPVG